MKFDQPTFRKMHYFCWFLCLVLSQLATNPILIHGQPIAGECEMAPHWTVDGRNVMSENRGSVTLLALMELHCSFCRSQIEGPVLPNPPSNVRMLFRLIALTKMLKNESINEVQFVVVAPWNESAQYVDYFRRYLEPTGIKVFQETVTELVWSKIKGNKDDFFVYDACGRLSYYIPYPQSYLYYHYTVSTLYSTLRQEKCGPCRFIAALKVRAYLNVMARNTTTHHHYLEHTVAPRADQLPSSYQTTAPALAPDQAPGQTPGPAPPSVTAASGATKTKDGKRRPTKHGKKSRKTTTTTAPMITETATWPIESGELETATTAMGDELVTTGTRASLITPLIVDVVSGEEFVDEGASDKRLTPGAASPESMEPSAATAPSSNDFSEGTAQIPLTTIGTSASAIDGGIPPEEAEYEEEEYEEAADSDRHLNGGGAVGSVGASVVGAQRRVMRKRLNVTKATMTTIASVATTSAPIPTTSTKSITTSWSSDPKSKATMEIASFGRRGWGSTRVPKLADDVDCTSYTTSMCYRQWQEFGTLHTCCQRGVYLTDMCKAPLCNNATFHLCCFQKYQQAHFQCCYDDDLAADRPDDFSRCCYSHFVFDDDGYGDGDDQCCPRAVATYFWTTQTRVAELCLPNVELDLEGIVLEARMSDKSLVKIDLQQSSALQYECPYVDKRLDFFYWEPDSADDGSKLESTTVSTAEVDVPE